MLYTMLFQGEQIAYNEDNHTIEIANMFGYISCDNMSIKIANRIFETRLYNMFLSEEELSNAMSSLAKQDKNHFISNGRVILRQFLHFRKIQFPVRNKGKHGIAQFFPV